MLLSGWVNLFMHPDFFKGLKRHPSALSLPMALEEAPQSLEGEAAQQPGKGALWVLLPSSKQLVPFNLSHMHMSLFFIPSKENPLKSQNLFVQPL